MFKKIPRTWSAIAAFASIVVSQELSSQSAFYTGAFDKGAIEISTYHPASKKLYVVNADLGGVEVLSFANLDSIVPVDTIDVSAFAGGVMMYDVTNPQAPVFVQYYLNRDFSAVTEAELAQTHLGPEGLLYIPAQDSPNGEDLIVVSNEVSGSLEVLKFTMDAPAQIAQTIDQVNLVIQDNQIHVEEFSELNVYNLMGEVIYNAKGFDFDLAQLKSSSPELVIVDVQNASGHSKFQHLIQ